MDGTLHTKRLTLIATTIAHLRTELDTPEQLGAVLGAVVSPDWPTGEYDRGAMEFFRARLEEGGAAVVGWYGWYALRHADAEGPCALVGSAGYFGPPSPEGTVEIGYSVLPEWQRRGYAVEIVEALAANAFAHAAVHRVIARATESNVASIGVLTRAGFVPAGTSEDAKLRFVRER
jgi:RimJ/RimL family protein N-acetyltransferase